MGTEYIGGFGPIPAKARELTDVLALRLATATIVVSDRRSTHRHECRTHQAEDTIVTVDEDHKVTCHIYVKGERVLGAAYSNMECRTYFAFSFGAGELETVLRPGCYRFEAQSGIHVQIHFAGR